MGVFGTVFGGVFGLVWDGAVVPPVPVYVAPTWTSEALELWEELWTNFGTYATYGPARIRVIKNPIKSAFMMDVPTNYKRADTIIDMLRTDAIKYGLYQININDNPTPKRPVVQISGQDYTINALENDDDTQPSVRLPARSVA